MNTKVVGASSAIVMAVVILLAQKFTDSTVDTLEAGQKAELKKLIGEVIDEKHTLDDGTTYGAALSTLVTDVAVMKSQMGALTEE